LRKAHVIILSILKEEFTERGTITRVFSPRYAAEKIVDLYSKKIHTKNFG